MPETAPTVLDNYRAAVSANPNSAEAHSNLAAGLYGQQKYDEAIQAYEKALALDSNLVDAHYGLALTLKQAGHKDRSAQEFEIVIKLAPQLESGARAQMLSKLAQGHINHMRTGDWHLGQAGLA